MAVVVRRRAGIYAYEESLRRGGFAAVAGADEAGRGACAGPLVAAAVILGPREADRIPGLADSKLLSAARRETVYDEIVGRAVAWSVVEVGPDECDQLGMQQADLTGLRRAVLRLDPPADFALTDGFEVAGLPMPSLAVWKGDRIAACVAAASVIAKVTRDRLMTSWHERYPDYAFDIHKGYCTKLHQERLETFGATDIHRRCFDNVARVLGRATPRTAGAGSVVDPVNRLE